jgi:hypothetical protein
VSIPSNKGCPKLYQIFISIVIPAKLVLDLIGERESSLFLDITGVLDASLRGHDVKK